MKKLLLYLLGLVGLAPETKLNLNSEASAEDKIYVNRPGEGIYLPPLFDAKVEDNKLMITGRTYKALANAGSEPVLVQESHQILPKKELPPAPTPQRKVVPLIEPLGGLTSLDELQPGDKVARRTSSNAFQALVYKVEGWIDENTLLLRRPKGNLVFEFSIH